MRSSYTALVTSAFPVSRGLLVLKVKAGCDPQSCISLVQVFGMSSPIRQGPPLGSPLPRIWLAISTWLASFCPPYTGVPSLTLGIWNLDRKVTHPGPEFSSPLPITSDLLPWSVTRGITSLFRWDLNSTHGQEYGDGLKRSQPCKGWNDGVGLGVRDQKAGFSQSQM